MSAESSTFTSLFQSTQNTATRSSNPATPQSKPASNGFAVVALVLATIAICVSVYLAYVGLTASKVVGCDGGLFNCEHVLTSRWSQVFGIPVSIPAVGLYGVVIAAIITLKWGSASQRRLAWTALSTLSFAAATTAAWFISLQVFSIGHLCPYCLVVHGCGFLLATAVLINHRGSGLSVTKTMLAGLLFAGTLVAVQAFGPVPDTFVIETHEPAASPLEFDPLDDGSLFESPIGANEMKPNNTYLTSVAALSWFSIVGVMMADESAAAAEPTTAPPVAPRLVPVVGGKHHLNARRWPVWGNVDAKYLIVEMFDYTCEHCRNTHHSIKQAAPLLGNDFAVLTLPVPLHRDCNDAATNSSPERADACEIARLAISVWLVDASKFTAYHDWLFEQKRSAGEARAFAETLVDRDALAAELAKGIASQYIAKNVMLYKEAGAGTVPKISFPTTTVVGEIGSANSVADIVRQQFAR